MNSQPHQHRRRFYVRQMYNKIHKEMTKFRKAFPLATVEEQKLKAFQQVILLNRRADIAMLPISMTEHKPQRVVLSITNPERPTEHPFMVAV